jgi:Fe-S oxidoreductase
VNYGWRRARAWEKQPVCPSPGRQRRRRRCAPSATGTGFADLVARGVLSLRTPLTGTHVTYHDPCYLARYNRISEAPRTLIEATGAELVEMPRHGTDTFCCGAGGGRIWMMDEPETGERPSEQRIREALTLGEIDYFLVSCPKDLAMYTDAVKVVGAAFEVADLTSLVERALGQAESVPAESV